MKELIIGKNCTAALHTDGSGMYQGIRELVVAVITKYSGDNGEPFDWAAYRAFVPYKMDIEEAKQIVSMSGDKLHRDDARSLFPGLDEVPYRG